MKTTFSRFFFTAALILLVALLLVGTGFQTLVRSYLEQQTLDHLQVEAETISELIRAYHADGVEENQEFFVNISVASRVSQASAVICDSQGALLLCSDAPLGCDHQGMQVSGSYLAQVMESGCVRNISRMDGLYDELRFVVGMPISLTSGEKVGMIIVSTPTDSIALMLQRMSDIYLTISVLVVLLAVVLMSLFARQQSNPLRKLAKAANDFGHGDLSARVILPDSTAREVQEVALAFNNMADSLEKSETSRQEFVANVSHELKTPMTTISGMVDGVLDGTIPPEKQTQYLQIVSEETKRLSRLVRSMLDISRMQGNAISEEQKSRFDVGECAGQVLLRFEQKILSKDLQVLPDFPETPVFTLADLDAITQVIYNLLDNAVKFCPEGGELSVSVRTGGSKIYVSVGNTGATIPAEELPLVFNRFHKLDKARGSRDGWGLGLYIVKTLVGRHGEDISVTSENGRTEFTFTLPLVN